MNYGHALPYIERDKVKQIFELGARDCNDSIALYKEFGCPVYAFECNPDGLALCRETLKGAHGIELIEKAVTSYDGVTSFYAFDSSKNSNIGASSLFQHKELSSAQKKITVPCCRLDTFMAERGLPAPDLLCMDIQGGELTALQSMGPALRDVTYIATECSVEGCYEGSYTFNDIYTYLTDQGFELIDSGYLHVEIVDFLNGHTRGIKEMDVVFERLNS